MRRTLSASAREARIVALPPIGIPRLAHVPPPYGISAVSPERTATASTATPSSSATICATAVGIPCPCSVIPTSAVTAPDGSMRTVAPSWPEIGAPPTP
jgi:hypothetical protein